MQKFRKRPLVVEAMQYTAENCRALHAWLGYDYEHVDEGTCGVANFTVETLEGPLDAMPGDWIIRGVAGELYPCRGAIFEATYEPVED